MPEQRDQQPKGPTFTELFKQLQDESCMNPVDAYENFRKKMAGVLRGNMRKRGLWNEAAELLGYTGNWKDEQTFGDLLDDCYMFNYMRFKNLTKKLKVYDSIDGYIYINIKNFLFEKQKKNDPIGYKVFTKLKEAICCAINICSIKLYGSKNAECKIDNNTLLVFVSPNAITPDALSSSDIESKNCLENAKKILHNNKEWTENIQYKLARLERIREKSQQIFCEKIVCDMACQLKNLKIETCHFKDFLQVFKEDVRAINPQVEEEPFGDDSNDEVFEFDPDEISKDNWNCWHQWRDNMIEAIDKTNVQERTRDKLRQIFIERMQAIEKFELPSSQNKLASMLNISTGSVNNAMKKIRQLAKEVGKPNDCEELQIFNRFVGEMLR